MVGCAFLTAIILIARPATAAADSTPISQPENSISPNLGPRPTGFAADEWADLAQVVDRTDAAADDGLAILLGHVEKFKPDSAASVKLSDLLSHPADYRGRPVRLTVKYASRDSRPDPEYPREDGQIKPARPRPIRRVYNLLTYAPVDGAAGPEQAVFLISTWLPAEAAPKFERRPFQVEGYFYKLQRVKARGSDRMIDVPVLVAGKVIALTSPAAWFDRAMVAIIGSLTAVAVGWEIIRRRKGRKVVFK